jgi:hypothetical protein
MFFGVEIGDKSGLELGREFLKGKIGPFKSCKTFQKFDRSQKVAGESEKLLVKEKNRSIFERSRQKSTTKNWTFQKLQDLSKV